ncbi:MAG: hypothetical protein HZB99_00390 [Candidatus Harrisonbacteria bacterium]|nr:hypothetical protein [Candidatus Harrisonbacteria bacterium]
MKKLVLMFSFGATVLFSPLVFCKEPNDTEEIQVENQVETFPISVNYDLSVESMVAMGKYDGQNYNFTTKNFPTIRKGEVDLVLGLVHFNGVLTSEEALKELDKMGYRPAELRELLVFGAKYSDIWNQFPPVVSVVALGSVWLDPNARRNHYKVPYLLMGSGGRYMEFNCFDCRWHEGCRFLAVRESYKYDYDKTKSGWTLLEDTSFDGKQFVPDIVEFLKPNESYVRGDVMKQRAKELNAHLSQRHAEYLLEHQDLIPKEWQGKYYLIFPGTVWQDWYGGQRVAYLYWDGDQWNLSFFWLEIESWGGPAGRLVGLRK